MGVARFQRHACARNVTYHGSAHISRHQEAQSWRPSSVVPLCFMLTLAADLQIHGGVGNELLGGSLGIAWLPWDCGRFQMKAAHVTSERKLTGPSCTGTRDTSCFRQVARNIFLLTVGWQNPVLVPVGTGLSPFTPAPNIGRGSLRQNPDPRQSQHGQY